MNILLACSSHDGPLWAAFSLESLNLELEYHKNIYDAINFARKERVIKNYSDRTHIETFGNQLEVIWGEITDKGYFLDAVLNAGSYLSDENSEEYDPRYKRITIEPPFHIDEVFEVRIFT